MIKLPDQQNIIRDYFKLIEDPTFSCIAAKAALKKKQIKCFVAGHMACPHDDANILKFLYEFIDHYRNSKEMYHSAAVFFKAPEVIDEELFERFLWQRLQSLSDLDKPYYAHDKRVSARPHDRNFSFSLKGEAMFVIGLHAGSSRKARRFRYPSLIFNPHQQFEDLRASGKFAKMKYAVRKKEVALSGSINPMLRDFGEFSEVYQYSGKVYDDNWQCPLKISNG
ncbi:guanitoxin biosynthesis heme-dependent pre-guanitoxin N-hydroxylase GntA [soil metagenome]